MTKQERLFDAAREGLEAPPLSRAEQMRLMSQLYSDSREKGQPDLLAQAEARTPKREGKPDA